MVPPLTNTFASSVLSSPTSNMVNVTASNPPNSSVSTTTLPNQQLCESLSNMQLAPGNNTASTVPASQSYNVPASQLFSTMPPPSAPFGFNQQTPYGQQSDMFNAFAPTNTIGKIIF